MSFALGLCEHRDVFGRPGEGVHAYRIFRLAAVDVVGTIGICVAIAYAFGLNVWATLAAGFLLGIVMHRLFCVNTTINRALFGAL